MLIGRVVGDLTAARKHESYDGKKILLVQPLTLDGEETGAALVALDAVSAGIGDRVLLVTDGYAAFSSVGRDLSPIDMAVIAIVDRVDLAAAALPANPSPGQQHP